MHLQPHSRPKGPDPKAGTLGHGRLHPGPRPAASNFDWRWRLGPAPRPLTSPHRTRGMMGRNGRGRAVQGRAGHFASLSLRFSVYE